MVIEPSMLTDKALVARIDRDLCQVNQHVKGHSVWNDTYIAERVVLLAKPVLAFVGTVGSIDTLATRV